MRARGALVIFLFACACGDSGSTAVDDAGPNPGDGGTADAAPDPPVVVDPSTLEQKLIFGYQGWFFCPGDGSVVDRWVHWFRNQTPDETSVTVDLWPDTAELGGEELCTTGFTRPDGSPAPVYSAYNPTTVARHFQWMKEYGIDGVMLQRFTSELSDPAFLAARNRVAENVRAAAEAHGRVFAIMYDISGQNPDTMIEMLESDWQFLVDELAITDSPRYLRHKGKPVLAIWGFGFADRPASPAQATELIAWFQSGAASKYQVTLMGGVPREWRMDPAWRDVIRQLDIISPWTVGAFVDDAGADNYRTTLEADVGDASQNGAEYMPVVFPGFSWHNLNDGPLNQIPRRGGRFYWRQVHNAIAGGSTMIYGAMFDEVDEGTAMFKMAPTSAQLPAQGAFVPLDVDGESLPSDWYLRVAGAASKMLRGEIALSPTLPSL